MTKIAGLPAKFHSSGIHKFPQEWLDSCRNYGGTVKTSNWPEGSVSLWHLLDYSKLGRWSGLHLSAQTVAPKVPIVSTILPKVPKVSKVSVLEPLTAQWETWCTQNEECATCEMDWCVNTKTNTHTHNLNTLPYYTCTGFPVQGLLAFY